MSQKRIPIPPRLGGGDVIMRTVKAGEVDDSLKAHPITKGQEGRAIVTHQTELLFRTIVEFRGKPLPAGGDLEEWWRGQEGAMRSFLLGCYNRMNAVDDKEIDDFFAAAEAVMVATPSSRT